MTDGCHVKPRLLDLIGCIAMGLPDEYLLYEFTSRKATKWGVELVKLGPSAVQKASMSLDMTECKAGIYAFLCLHQSELVGLLQSEEELLRVKALYIMAWLKDFQSINWKIQHFLSTPNERGEIELGTAILAYWLNSLHSGLKIEEDVVRRFLDSRLKIVRAAAAIALAEQCNAEDAIEILVLVSQDESLQLGGRSFPFYNGDLPGLAQLVLDEQ